MHERLEQCVEHGVLEEVSLAFKSRTSKCYGAPFTPSICALAVMMTNFLVLVRHKRHLYMNRNCVVIALAARHGIEHA